MLGDPDWETPLLAVDVAFGPALSEDEGETKEFTLHSEDELALDSERHGVDGRAYRSVEHDRNQDNSLHNLSRAHSLKFNPTFDVVLPPRVVEDAGESGMKFFEDAKETPKQEAFRMEFSLDQMKQAEIDPDDSDYDIRDEEELFDPESMLKETSEPSNSRQKTSPKKEASPPRIAPLAAKNSGSEKKLGSQDLAQYDSLNTPKQNKESPAKDHIIIETTGRSPQTSDLTVNAAVKAAQSQNQSGNKTPLGTVVQTPQFNIAGTKSPVSKREKDLEDTVAYLLSELQHARAALLAPSPAEDEDSAAKEILALRAQLAASEKVRRDLQDRLLKVSSQFDDKIKAAKEEMIGKAKNRVKQLEKKNGELHEEVSVLRKELELEQIKNQQAAKKSSSRPKQVIYASIQREDEEELDEVCGEEEYLERTRNEPFRRIKPPIMLKDNPKSRSISPKPSVIDKRIDLSTISTLKDDEESLNKLYLENRQLKEHIRQMLAGKHANIHLGVNSQQLSTDQVVVTNHLLRINPGLVITAINEATLEVNKRRIILGRDKHGRPGIRVKNGVMSVEEFADWARLKL